MLESVKSIIEKKKYVLSINVPKHIAITTDGIEKWALKNNIPYRASGCDKGLSEMGLNT